MAQDLSATPRSSKRNRAPHLHGWINFYKSPGLSSNQCLTKIKYLLGRPKIGHAGTLDPLAFGILPVALGEATKVTSYLLGAPKTYRFVATWGEQRSTDDAAGEVLETSSHRPQEEDVRAAMAQFSGTFSQTPPIYSAKKIQGRPSYALARKGQAVDLPDATICVRDFQLLSHTGNTSEFQVTCSKGTYVRALVRDMGIALGCLGYASLIERRQVGPFDINSAISMEKLEIAVKTSILEQILIPLQAVLDDIPAVLVDPVNAQRLRQGQGVSRRDVLPQGPSLGEEADRVAIFCDGSLVALGQWRGEELMPARVFKSD